MTKKKPVKIIDTALSTKDSPYFPKTLEGAEQPEEGFETEQEAAEWFDEANIQHVSFGKLNAEGSRFIFLKV
jgi:hypothetical protein